MGLIMMSYMMVLGGIYLIFGACLVDIADHSKLEYFYQGRGGRMEKHYSNLR